MTRNIKYRPIPYFKGRAGCGRNSDHLRVFVYSKHYTYSIPEWCTIRITIQSGTRTQELVHYPDLPFLHIHRRFRRQVYVNYGPSTGKPSIHSPSVALPVHPLRCYVWVYRL